MNAYVYMHRYSGQKGLPNIEIEIIYQKLQDGRFGMGILEGMNC
jgi:hypothetical protein